MKKNVFYIICLLFAGVLGFSSCSSSDDDASANLNTPQYDSDAALYTITSSTKPFNTIELTGSGNYLINKNSTRADSYGGFYLGTFTKDGDTYILQDYPTNGTNTKMQIVNTDGGCQVIFGGITYSATKTTSSIDDNAATKSLCRTWYFDYVSVDMSIPNKSNEIKNFKYEGDNFTDFAAKLKEFYNNNGFEDASESVSADYMTTIFTKNGNVITKGESNIQMMEWAWKDSNHIYMQPNLKKLMETAKQYSQAAQILSALPAYTVSYSGSKLVLNLDYTYSGISLKYNLRFHD